jgi:hypothetical protein
LCYSARPDPSYDPNQCIFEVAVYELYPKGKEPQTEWTYTPVGDPNWLSVLPQDFSNMAAVQQGMKSAGFPGTKPNPYRDPTGNAAPSTSTTSCRSTWAQANP